MPRKWSTWMACSALALFVVASVLPERALAGPQEGNAIALWVGSEGVQPKVLRLSSGLGSGGYLGVNLEEVTSDNRAQLGLTKEEGALVQDVEKDSPAAEAGLLKGDVIAGYAGFPVFSAAQLARLVAETPVGRRVEIDVLRSGKRLNLEARIGKRSAEEFYPRFSINRDEEFLIRPEGWQSGPWNFLPRFLQSDSERPRLGVSIVELTDQLAEKYGLKGKEGALVTSVRAGSPAEKAGLKAGDVITEINGRSVDSAEAISRALGRSEGREVEVKIYRDRQPMTLRVQLETTESSSKGKSRVIL